MTGDRFQPFRFTTARCSNNNNNSGGDAATCSDYSVVSQQEEQEEERSSALVDYAGMDCDRRTRLLPSSSKNNDNGNTFDSSSFVTHKYLAKALAVLTTISIPTCIIVLVLHAQQHYRADSAAFFSAGVFVVTTLVLSTRLIYQHLTNWYMPDVQKYVVRIVWMVPLYAVQSWLSLRFRNARIYIDTMRDLYEAYVIQSFVYYLVELLGGDDNLVLILQNKDSHYGHHTLPVRRFFCGMLHNWEMGTEFMLQCKHGVLQYVALKTLATLITALLEPLGLYGEGTFDWTKGYPYVSLVINVSQMYALYCLVKLFHATSDDLRSPPVDWRPMGKFLCVKGVVFFTWWQGVGIAILRGRGIIANIGNWDADDVANGVQNYLVCMEMFFFAIAHSYTFTHEEYLPTQRVSSLFDGEGYHVTRHDKENNGFVSSFANNRERNDDEKYGVVTTNHNYEGEEDADYYRPPTIRTLNVPMGFRDAFWSSTLPNETLKDMKRLRNGVSDQVRNQALDPGMISMACLQNAESI